VIFQQIVYFENEVKSQLCVRTSVQTGVQTARFPFVEMAVLNIAETVYPPSFEPQFHIPFYDLW
jgi:hypothetical protein